MTIKPVFGLQKDSVLTRETSKDNFLYESEYAGKDHSFSNKVSLSESLITKDSFVAIEWFEDKPLTNKEQIAKLKENVKNLEDQLARVTSEKSLIQKRIDTKISEFESQYSRVSKLTEDMFHQDDFSWANEAMTVYYNMIDLLKKIKA